MTRGHTSELIFPVYQELPGLQPDRGENYFLRWGSRLPLPHCSTRSQKTRPYDWQHAFHDQLCPPSPPPLGKFPGNMTIFLLLSATVLAVCSASFIPPYYGGYFDDHASNYADHNNKYGGYGGTKHGHGSGYDQADYERAAGEDGYYGADYGSRGSKGGHAKYDNGGADGYDNAHHDAGAKNSEDAEGQKKYSYFTSGSGPEGSYSKGYYGSEGYDHADFKSKYAADATGSGYKKGFNYDENDHADAHSAFDKEKNGHTEYGKKHDDAYHGDEKDAYEKAGHSNGWVNGEHGGSHAAHGPSYH